MVAIPFDDSTYKYFAPSAEGEKPKWLGVENVNILIRIVVEMTPDPIVGRHSETGASSCQRNKIINLIQSLSSFSGSEENLKEDLNLLSRVLSAVTKDNIPLFAAPLESPLLQLLGSLVRVGIRSTSDNLDSPIIDFQQPLKKFYQVVSQDYGTLAVWAAINCAMIQIIASKTENFRIAGCFAEVEEQINLCLGTSTKVSPSFSSSGVRSDRLSVLIFWKTLLCLCVTSELHHLASRKEDGTLATSTRQTIMSSVIEWQDMLCSTVDVLDHFMRPFLPRGYGDVADYLVRSTLYLVGCEQLSRFLVNRDSKACLAAQRHLLRLRQLDPGSRQPLLEWARSIFYFHVLEDSTADADAILELSEVEVAISSKTLESPSSDSSPNEIQQLVDLSLLLVNIRSQILFRSIRSKKLLPKQAHIRLLGLLQEFDALAKRRKVVILHKCRALSRVMEAACSYLCHDAADAGFALFTAACTGSCHASLDYWQSAGVDEMLGFRQSSYPASLLESWVKAQVTFVKQICPETLQLAYCQQFVVLSNRLKALALQHLPTEALHAEFEFLSFIAQAFEWELQLRKGARCKELVFSSETKKLLQLKSDFSLLYDIFALPDAMHWESTATGRLAKTAPDVDLRDPEKYVELEEVDLKKE